MGLVTITEKNAVVYFPTNFSMRSNNRGAINFGSHLQGGMVGQYEWSANQTTFHHFSIFSNINGARLGIEYAAFNLGTLFNENLSVSNYSIGIR